MDLPKVKEDILKEFDRIYIHENAWKSEDESHAFAPVEGMRQFIWDSLDKYALAILKEVEGMAHAHCGKKDCLQGQCINRSIKKEFAKYISSIINESISK